MHATSKTKPFSVHTPSYYTEMEQPTREIFVLIGLAGAGKSTAAQIISEEHDENVETYEVSDFVRDEYQSGNRPEVSDNGLGNWAARIKEVEGQDTFVRDLAEDIKSPQTPHVAISGVRSPEEAVAIRDVFENADVSTIGVWTMPDIRFERKYDATPSTEHDEWQTFVERNERELWEWGAIEFFARDSMHEADYIIPNHDSIRSLRNHIERLLNGRGQYDKNPFPHDDYERVAQYL
jgi:dephospho-CoA kinase